MEELLKRLMSYARVAILLIISLIMMSCGQIDHYGVLFVIGLVVAIVTAVRFAWMAIWDIVWSKLEKMPLAASSLICRGVFLRME